MEVQPFQEISIWQSVVFRNLSLHRFWCNGHGDLAKDCQQVESKVDNGEPVEADKHSQATPEEVEELHPRTEHKEQQNYGTAALHHTA